MTTGIKRKRIGFYSIQKPKRLAKPKQATRKQERSDSQMSTDEYIEYLKRDVEKLEIKSLVASTPEERKKLETRKAKRNDLLQAMIQWFGKKGRIEAKAYNADGSPIEPEIIH